MYRVGIIGCGRIASGFEDEKNRDHPCTHAGAFSKNPKTNIVCAADIDEQKLATFSKRWNVSHVYSDYKNMLDKENLDIVSVCTHPDTHAAITIDSAKAGVKAIFCEKPIATSVKDAEKMVDVCDEYGVKLTVNHSRRWDANYQYVRNLLLENKLGKVVGISGCYTSGLRVIGTHMIDLMMYFLGEINAVLGIREDTSGVDSLWYSENYSPKDPPVSGLLWFRNGSVGKILGTCKTKYPLFDVDIFTTGGRISIRECGLFGYSVEIHELNGDRMVSKNTFNSRNNNLMVTAIDDIVLSIENNKSTVSTGKDALKTMAVLESLAKSSNDNKIVSC
jgi:predicted dehydrogenase